MSRKRKSQGNSITKRPILPILRAMGIAVGHPVILQDTSMRMRNKKEDSTDVMKMLCFSGIPACCLSAKGSGPNNLNAEETASHAMLDFFRTVLPSNVIASLCLGDPNFNFQPFFPIFEEFEKTIAEDYLSISRCSQYDMTPAATIRGKEVKKRVVNALSPSNSGTIKEPRGDFKNQTDEDNDIVIINIEEDKRETNKNTKQMDEVIILGDDYSAYNSKNANFPKVQVMRNDDSELKRKADQRKSEELRRRLYTGNAGNVDFGQVNMSGAGPAEVFCCIPNSGGSTVFQENYGSDSDDGIPKKRTKNDSEVEESPAPSSLTDSITNAAFANEASTSKESDEEIGEMIDEWDESDDVESNEVRMDEKINRNSSMEGNINSGSMERLFEGQPTLEQFLVTKNLPANYQARTIGVIINKTLAQTAESYVGRVASKSLNSLTELSKLTWDHYFNNSQPESIYDQKMRARLLLYQEIQKLFTDKRVTLQVTGSTINGCGSYNSDVDMCLCCPTNGYRGQGFDDFQCDRSFSLRTLRKIDKTYRRLHYSHPFKRLVKYCQLIPAKVPIVKLLLNGEFEGMDIDINVNNIAGIYNSHLIHYYSLCDARFPALALMIKHWAMRAGVNNSPDGYLNSYTIILMAVHYLQCGVRPAVLPNLQYLFPDKFDRKLPLEELILFGDIATKLPALPPNTCSLGELLVGFFFYFANFDFDKYAISIRSAQVVLRNHLPKNTSHYPMFVEEPFDAINTARSVRTSSHMNAIKSAFSEASATFSQSVFKTDDLGVEVVARK
uniref:PAP-associated domain-containing protein n=2 Tax=Caenorhabditis japonica TaxID=281687 RepID=A0A8R1DG70_CAEJA